MILKSVLLILCCVFMPFPGWSNPINALLGNISYERCLDEVFVRRVFLDITGTIPRAFEAKGFINSSKLQKRSLLIDDLLERDSFADYWTMKWCDLLRVKSEFPSKLWPNAVQAYHKWLHYAMLDNMPYNDFARKLLTSSGSNFRVAPVNFYRALPNKTPEGIAEIVALTFMGTRLDHWSEDKRQGMAAFFSKIAYKPTSEWKEEIVYFNPTNQYPHPFVFPNGKSVSISSHEDPRDTFTRWLIHPDNPWFAKAIVNRVWYWLTGRGLVHEPDDLRSDNPPEFPALLALLEKELIDYEFDLKHLFRIILNSRVYQMSLSHPLDNPKKVPRYYPRRLEAEVLIDAINRITNTIDPYSSRVPEPFTFIPEDQPSVQLADGSITSSFLEMFGRPSRDTGFESERNNELSAKQMMHLLNSTHILKKIQKNTKKYMKKMNQTERMNRIYLEFLSRFPVQKERKVFNTYRENNDINMYHAIVDLQWALINCKEFLFKH